MAAEDSKDSLKFVSGRDSKGQQIESVSGFSTTVIQKAFKDHAPVIVTGSDEGEALGSRSAVVHNLRSIMAVPIKVKNQTIGVLYVDSSLAKGLFKKSDLDLLEAVGSQIGVAFEMERAAKTEIEKQRLQNELKVQAALHELSSKIKLLVDNMEQALFAVSADKLIQGPVSNYTGRLLGENLIGTNVIETLYKDIPRDSELMGRINTALSTVFGEDSLQWDLMSDNFPRKIDYQTGNSTRTFSIKYSPVLDKNENVEKIAFVVDDITELELLEKELAEKRKEAILIQELLGCEKSSLASFFEHAQTLLDEVHPQDANLLARHLHTIKGNARLLGLFSISESFHQIETDFLNQKGDLAAITQNSKETLGRYLKFVENFLGGGLSSPDAQQIPLEYIEMLRNAVEHMNAKIQKADYENLKLLVNKLSEVPFSKTLSVYAKMAAELGQKLAKAVQVTIHCSNGVSVPKKLDNLLRDCMTHIVRNAVDHGIDSEGTISITANEDAQNLTVVIADNGRGIDPNVIAQTAVKRGVVSQQSVQAMTDDEKRMLILLPGFSTKDQATDVSGRGVGMDVVKTNIESVGGALKLDSIVGRGSTFTLVVPKYG